VLLTKDEIESNIIKAVLRMKTREDYEEKLGRTVDTFALYEKEGVYRVEQERLFTSNGFIKVAAETMNRSFCRRYCRE
jgi:flagellar motor component MotA